MAGIHITDIEAAINHWRERSPSADGVTACPEVRALAEVYALMVYYRESHCDESTMPGKAHAAWLAWYATTPDTPCIAICSTSQGDALCKGCGRTFDEVQHWTTMTPAEKRSTWRRIVLDGTAWRFNRYAERAGADRAAGVEGAPPPPDAGTSGDAAGSADSAEAAVPAAAQGREAAAPEPTVPAAMPAAASAEPPSSMGVPAPAAVPSGARPRRGAARARAASGAG